MKITEAGGTLYRQFIKACKAQRIARYSPCWDDGRRGAGCIQGPSWKYSGDGLGTWHRINPEGGE